MIDRRMCQAGIDYCFVSETKYHSRKDTSSYPFLAASSRPPQGGAYGPVPYGCALLGAPSLYRTHNARITIVATDPEGMFLVWNDGDVQFIGVYTPPFTNQEQMENACQIVERAINAANRHPLPKRVLCGDLNLRMAKPNNVWAPISRLDLDYYVFLQSCGFNHVPLMVGQKTYIGFDGTHSSCLDHFFASNEALDMHLFTACAMDEPHHYDLGSDHLMVTIEYNAEPTPQELAPRQRLFRYNLGRLKDKDTLEAYRDYMATTMAFLTDERILAETGVLDDPQSYIDRMENVITTAVRDVAQTILGESERGVRHIPRVRWTHSMHAYWNEKIRICQELEHGIPRPEAIARLLELNALWNQEMSNQRNLAFMDFFQDIDQFEAPELGKILKSMARRRIKPACVLHSTEEALAGYADFYENQYNTATREHTPFRLPSVPHRDVERDFFTQRTVMEVVKRMPRGKATGTSGFAGDLICRTSSSVSRPLALLFNTIMRLGVIPTSWHRAMLVPIPKVPHPVGIEEHRPISLTEHLRKCFEHCLLGYLTATVEPLCNAQCGFRTERSTLDQAATLNELQIQFKNRTKNDLLIIFLDIKAAYDSVDRGLLFQKLQRKGVSPIALRIIDTLFNSCSSQVCVKGQKSRRFNHAAGLMQGSVLSPTLYSVFIDDLAEELKAASTLRLGGMPVGGLFYADDIALVAEDVETMRRLLAVCERHSLANNYRFNVGKCKTFSPDGTFLIYDQLVPSCEVFKYLGIYFDKTAVLWTRHVKEMIEKADKVCTAFQVIGFNSRGMSLRTKLMIYKLFIRSVMEYGLAIMPKKMAVLHCLQKAQNKFLNKMMGTHKACSRSLHSFLMCQSMFLRHAELSARWGCALVFKTGQHFLVASARAAYTRLKRAASSFYYIDNSHSIRNYVLELCREHRLLGDRRWRKKYDIVKEIYRFGEADMARQQSLRKNAIILCEDLIPRQAYAIGKCKYKKRRVLELYLIGRLIGKPFNCLRCGARAHQRHMVECAGFDVDSAYRNKNLAGAYLNLRSCLIACHPEARARYSRFFSARQPIWRDNPPVQT